MSAESPVWLLYAILPLLSVIQSAISTEYHFLLNLLGDN